MRQIPSTSTHRPSGPSNSVPVRTGQGAEAVRLWDFGPSGRHPGASVERPRGAEVVGDGVAGSVQIAPLDLSRSAALRGVLVPDTALPPADADGVRRHNQRTYLDLITNETVHVDYNPVTGTYHERAPHALQPSDVVLRRIGSTATWTRAAPSAGSPSVPVRTPPMGRVDPLWDLRVYDASGISPTPLQAMPGKRVFTLQGQAYYIDATFFVANYKKGNHDIHRFNDRNAMQRCGAVSEDGVIQVWGNSLLNYLAVQGVNARVEVDPARNKWKLMAVPGATDVFIERGGRMESWVPELQLSRIATITAAARKVLGYTHVNSDMSVGLMSTMDKRTYCYMRQYARQIIAFENPSIRRASALEQDALVDAHIWKHGYPYDRLLAALTAKAEDKALPVGVPAFDPLQGMATMRSRTEGTFNVQAIADNDQFCYPQRLPHDNEQAALAQWRSLDVGDTRQRGAANERMYRLMLENDGYQVLKGGTYGGGQNGFDLVFKGPAQDVYLLEVKHVPSHEGGRLRSVGMARGTQYFQMEDGWVKQVLSKPEACNSPAGQAVKDALRRNRLFKLIGATTHDGGLVLFKIDMGPVRAGP